MGNGLFHRGENGLGGDRSMRSSAPALARMLRRSGGLFIVAVLLAAGPLQAAELSVTSISLTPGGTGTVVVAGNIAGESTFGYTILVELVPRAGNTGTVTFTPAPPVDVTEINDPWPGAGTFSPFDTDSSGSLTQNGAVSDNGTFVPGALTFTGDLAGFPVVASTDASGTWDVVLTTASGTSSWEGLTTTLIAGTVTVAGTPCVVDTDCDDGNPCTDNICDATGTCQTINNTAPCDDGLFCTANDVCSGGTCIGSGDPCAGIG
ncbi:MAG: hypothetical protein D6788_03530, partial [Planctomycetota bacterium]